MANTALTSLKRTYLRSRVASTLEEFSDIFADLQKKSLPTTKLTHQHYKYLSELGTDFDKFTQFLQKPAIIKVADMLLEKVYRYLNFGIHETPDDVIAPQINGRMLLSSYIITGFPEFAISRYRHKCDEMVVSSDVNLHMYHLSKDLIDNLHLVSEGTTDQESIRQLLTSLIRYSNCFLVWSNQDKIEKMHQYIETWHHNQVAIEEIDSSSKYDAEQKEECTAAITKHQNDLVDLMKKLNPMFDPKILETYHITAVKLEDNYNKAYWDKVSETIAGGDTEEIINQLKNAMDDIKKIRANDTELHEKLDKHWDDFVDSELTDEVLIDYCDYVVKIITLMQSIEKSKESFKMWKQIRDGARNGYLGDKTSYAPKLLEFIFTQLRDFKDEVMGLYTLLSLGIDSILK